MEVLDGDVKDFIEVINKSVQKERVFIAQKDWTVLPTVFEREKLHDIQKLLVDRNIKHAQKLYKMVIDRDCDKHPEVKQMLDSLLEFFDIYEARYDVYVDNQDWDSYLEDGNTEIKNPEREIQFSSKVAQNVTSYKETVRVLRSVGDGSAVGIATFKNTPIPFLMRKNVEEKYDNVKELVERKLKENLD